ncbi:tyrosine-type recombinase/integrase [Variovorax sp. UMC13]|uniref:tyrosine-type recombinase/integrase n=1 Tax=Variovorax sp. UMC13 TaxID=1862326 RepID=UPI001603CCD6|nr:tyrosine-type recombinase/integrase [Variovorax sp. UMC13]MBB1599938.1 integrase [Variovorax sp. UMC13]
MGRKRERASGFGLLPRMEARPHAGSDKVTYRYHPLGGKPINLGQDKRAAIQKVLDLNGASNDAGTIDELWRAYQTMPQWKRLGERTKTDYAEYSVKLLEVMGKVSARLIRPADIARYLRVERAAAPVRANREIALLSNLMTVAVERGDIDVNPCKQVKRNLERPRTEAPDPDTFDAFIAWLNTQGPQRKVIAMMAEFAAAAGSRRIEFLHLTLPQIDSQAQTIRLMRAKQHGGAVRVESVSITEKMEDLVRRLRALPRPDECLHVFTTRDGNPYTDDGFASTWQRAMASALKDKVIPRRFTFHDLRAYYTTQHKVQYGTLPELHADAKTTARVYDRSRVSARKGL